MAIDLEVSITKMKFILTLESIFLLRLNSEISVWYKGVV